MQFLTPIGFFVLGGWEKPSVRIATHFVCLRRPLPVPDQRLRVASKECIYAFEVDSCMRDHTYISYSCHGSPI